MTTSNVNNHPRYFVVTRTYTGPPFPSEDPILNSLSKPLIMDPKQPNFTTDIIWTFGDPASEIISYTPNRRLDRLLTVEPADKTYDDAKRRMGGLIGDAKDTDVSIHGMLEGALEGEGVQVMHPVKEKTEKNVLHDDVEIKWWSIVKVRFD